jgi:hypothetical protein
MSSDDVAARLARIADPRANEPDVIRSLSGLGPPEEPAHFWVEIASDPAYTRDRRRQGIFQLLYRHLRIPTVLGTLADVLAGAPWLRVSDIAVQGDVGGHIPVTPAFGGTVLVIDVLPAEDHWLVYVNVLGHLEAADAFRVLREPSASDPVKSLPVAEIGFSPPVVNSLGAAT